MNTCQFFTISTNLVFFTIVNCNVFYSVYKITKVLFVVSTDHLAVQGRLTDVLRQLAVGFSRPQSQCLVAWLRELHRDRLRQLANPARGRLPPFLLSCSCTFVIRYTVYSWYTHFLRPSGAKFLRPHGGARRFGVPKT